jgi:hypothetical protein
MTDELLLERLIAGFGRFDDLNADETSPFSLQLAIERRDEEHYVQWRPIRTNTAPSSLEPLYEQLPARFPKLFEQLLLSYRWAEVDLGTWRLLANPPGPDLSVFFEQMSHDPALWSSLLPLGYVQFAKGPDVDYDPVCFDTKSRKKNGECRIVKIDHERDSL